MGIKREKLVVVISFGEPSIKNVLEIDYLNEKVKLQSPGYNGSTWWDWKDCLSQTEIDWYFIKKADVEVKRLFIKKAINQCDSL